MALCIHDIELATCGTCSPRPAPDPLPPGSSQYGPWFQACYRSGCDGCDGRIEPGDQIRSDGDGGWLCEYCGAGVSPGGTCDA